MDMNRATTAHSGPTESRLDDVTPIYEQARPIVKPAAW